MDSPFVQPGGLPDQADKDRVGGEVILPGDLPELSHRLSGRRERPGGVLQESRLPETERAVPFERGHAAEDAVVLEVREPPLDRLDGAGTGAVDELPEAGEDGPREGGGPRDVRVDAFVG